MKSIRTLTFISLFTGAMYIHAMQQNNNNNNNDATQNEARTEFLWKKCLMESFRKIDSNLLLSHDEESIVACLHEYRNQLLTPQYKYKQIDVSIRNKMNYAFSCDIQNMLRALGHPLTHPDGNSIQYCEGLAPIPVTNETKKIVRALAELRPWLCNRNLFQMFQLKNIINEPCLDNLPLAFDHASTNAIMQEAIHKGTQGLAEAELDCINAELEKQGGFDHYREATIVEQIKHPMWLTQ